MFDAYSEMIPRFERERKEAEGEVRVCVIVVVMAVGESWACILLIE